ncbi:MAG: SH3 domain-containing protein [Anaerolineales bacterium]
MNLKISSTFFIILLLCTGCDASLSTPTVTIPEFVTATLPVPATIAFTVTPTAETPSNETIAPTSEPITGTTTSEVNVRADTSTVSSSLGTISAFNTVQVTGKDPSGIWYQILFNNGVGWVRADFIQLADTPVEVSVVVPETGSEAVSRGVVLRGVNVRSGPGQDFDSLGLLNQNDVIPVYGKDNSSEWIKIGFSPAADGTGWVAAEFLLIDNIASIPMVNEVIETSPTTVSNDIPTIQPNSPIQNSSQNDADTAQSPAATFILSQAGSWTIQFQGELSAASGDNEDWIGFSSEKKEVVIQVSCDAASITVELVQEGAINNDQIECGKSKIIKVASWQQYLIKVTSKPVSESLVEYKLNIKIIK